MGITFVVDHQRRRIAARGQGHLSYQELCDYADAEQHDRAAGYDELFDATAADVTDLTAEQVRLLVLRVHLTPPPGSWGATAIVATQPVVFGLARMYATLCERFGARVEVFGTAAEAERWLDAHPGAPG